MRGGGVLLLGEVGGGLGAVGLVVVVGATDVEGPLVVEAEVQFLADVVAMEACGHGATGELQHLGAVFIEGLVVVDLPVVCLMMGVGGVGGEAPNGGIDIDVLVQAPLAAELSARGGRNGVATLVRDDVDDTRDGVGTIEG